MSTIDITQNMIVDLEVKISKWIDDFPDIHSVATQVAREILAKHTQLDRDPNTIYWHRFDSAQSSPLTFNGWQHDGYPVESMTLVELVVKRFRVSDQDGIDDLNVMAGFYTDDATHTRFDETNEVRLLAADVQADFWAKDFATLYSDYVEHFWRTEGDFFCSLSKVAVMSEALGQFNEGGLLAEDFLLVYATLIADLSRPYSLGQVLDLTGQPLAPAALHTFEIAGYDALTLLRLVDPFGRQILYCAGRQVAFQVFDNEQQMYAWVQAKAGLPVLRDRFISQFVRREALAPQTWVDLRRAMDSIAEQPWQAGQTLLCHRSVSLNGLSFDFARQQAHTAQKRDAQTLLTSNAQLRRQLWIGYLNAFMKVFGGLAPLDWPLALTMVGAGMLNVGLNSYEAANAHTDEARKTAILGAITSAIQALLNAPMLRNANELAELDTVDELEIQVSEELTNEISADVEVATQDEDDQAGMIAVEPESAPRQSRDEVNRQLAPYQANVRFRSDNVLGTEGHLRQVWMLEGDGFYIEINSRTYRVQLIGQRHQWVIVDPMNPFSFYGMRPVRLNEAGEWQLLPTLDLKGGGWPQASSPGSAPMPTVVKVPIEGVNNFLDRYTVPTVLGNRLAVFDADQGCWRLDHLGANDLVWRNAEGTWNTGDEAAYAAIKGTLPRPRQIKRIVLPQLPPVPTSATPIPKFIHYLWIGDRTLDAALLDNVVANAHCMPAYTSILHLDVGGDAQAQAIRSLLQFRAPNIQVSLLDDEPFFAAFKTGTLGEQYRLACTGEGRNYASAADVLRYPLVDQYGGIYMDIDDTFLATHASMDLPAQPNDVLLNDAVTLETLKFCGYNSSNFASHANNAVLKAVSREMTTRFRLNKTFYEMPRPVLIMDEDGGATLESQIAVDAYEKQVFELTGPSLFNDVLRSERADYYPLMLRKSLKNLVGVTSSAYEAQLSALEAHYFPFSAKVEVQIGSLHSWQSTR